MSELDLFNAAIKLTGDQRSAFLAAACGQDSALRKQVEDLLKANDETGGLLPRHTNRDLAATQAQTTQSQPGTMIGGRYKLIEAIGEGGMGTVWLAEQREPVRRKVAVKLVKAGMDSKSVLARFEAERQALAMMDHPNIAKVFDGGMTELGRPYFVMEFVKGVPLTEYCDQARLSLKERLNLFVPVCQAVQHAHQKGIIHRDLKPSNILICLYDGNPVPKVIDFGLAKAMHQSLTDQSLHTAFGMMVGTPLYMSPEQAEHNNLDVDTRTDIYSLGVILYELLTGSTPLERQQLKDAAFNEILRLIKEVEPQKPSTRLSGSSSLPSVAAQRSVDPRHLQRSLAGELDWIVMKTLEKERSRRYETANGLARDIVRFLNDEAVEACPPSTAYRLKKFLRKHKGKAIAAGAVLMALVLGIIGTGWGLLRAEAAKAAANRSADQAIASEEKTRTALEQETLARKRAQAAEARTLASYRDSTDDAILELIASKVELGYQERTYLQKTLKRWQAFADEQADDAMGRHYRAEGHIRVAFIWQQLGETTKARASFEQARDILQPLVEQFPEKSDYQDLLMISDRNLGILMAKVGETTSARTSYKRAIGIGQKLVMQFPSVPRYQNLLASSHVNLGHLFRDLGESMEARASFEQALDIRQKLVDQFPADPEYQKGLATSHYGFGLLLHSLGEHTAARTSYEKASEILVTLAKKFPAVREDQIMLVQIQSNMGDLLYSLGETPAARNAYEQACIMGRKLVEQFPAVPENKGVLAHSYNSLGGFLNHLGETRAARTALENACEIGKKLADQSPDLPVYQYNLAANHINLGNLLERLGETTAALTSYEQACDIQQTLVEKFPAIPDYQKSLAKSQSNLANALLVLGKNTAARTAQDQARDIFQKLVKQFPAVPEYQSDLASSHQNLGNVLNALGETIAARASRERARDIYQELVKQFPTVPKYQDGLARTHFNLANMLAGLGETAAARTAYEQSCDIAQKLVDQSPDAAEYRRVLATGHSKLGNLMNGLGETTAARTELEKARDNWQKLVEQFPGVAEYLKGLAESQNSLGIVFLGLGRLEEARAEFEANLRILQQLVDHFPSVHAYQINLGNGYNNYGELLKDEGQLEESLPWFNKAIQTLEVFDQKNQRIAGVKLYLAGGLEGRFQTYYGLKRYDDAIKDLERALELNVPTVMALLRSEHARAKAQADQTTVAIVEAIEVAKVDPKDAGGYHNLVLFNLACTYAITSGKIADKQQEYADRAMKLLEGAIATGYNKIDSLAKDPDLDPLREREDFKQLLLKLESSQPKAVEPVPSTTQQNSPAKP